MPLSFFSPPVDSLLTAPDSSAIVALSKGGATVDRAERLYAARKARKWTQDYVARRLGVTRGAVSQWESGGGLSVVAIQKVAKLYRLKLADLLPQHEREEP
jgi:DNA-binding XRE family transcriptional regulator